MIRPEGLSLAYSRNAHFWDTNLEGLTHADALVQPPVKGNCILWIAGHLLHYRGAIHRLLTLPEPLPVSRTERFARESAPVLGDEPGIVRFEQLMDAYHSSQGVVLPAIEALRVEQAQEAVQEFRFDMPRAELLLTFMRHESYHIGQFELLREIALDARHRA